MGPNATGKSFFWEGVPKSESKPGDRPDEEMQVPARIREGLWKNPS